MLELWAAIDLLSGSVVTLRQGKEKERTTWKEEPLDVAGRWEREGADGLHIIDLDAAFGKGSNREIVEAIVERAEIPVEVGGGVRTKEVAEELLDSGASRVIVGTIAYTDPKTLTALLSSRGADKIVVAADYSPDGSIMAKGWTASIDLSVFQAAKKMEALGVTNLLATAVGRDGMGKGPDVAAMSRLCPATSMKILASGGIRDVADLEQLANSGAAGAVVGRALYEKSVVLRRAKRALGERKKR